MERKLDVPFDPIAAARKVSRLPGVSFLYSGLRAYGLGRYSILAANPLKVVSSTGFQAIEEELKQLRSIEKGRLPFYGGPIGYLSYDAGRCLEMSQLKPSSGAYPDNRFAVYDGALVFDHEREETWLVSLQDEPSESLMSFCRRAFSGQRVDGNSFRLTSRLHSNFGKDEYLDAVEAVRSKIRSGDVYQVNLSQRFEADCEGDPFELFLELAERSPAPYAAYLDFGDEQIVSSSPERFLQIIDGQATTRPIKGTCSAGASEMEAAGNARDLENSEKDRSELLMIVDLERNDLGRVCEPGSVRVDDLFRLERYATVIHQTADVSGRLETGRTALDCVKAMFPGGSITGAPKIRAMQVIDELERGERGVYTGSIGYFDASGNVDLNIAIRTLRIAAGRLSFQVGGGIVWDSDPASEYDETLLKAKAMVNALGGSLDG
ncbi:aminodeoxychorismate synthase component I [Pelagicoccus sp. NFK12]|uniref:aminodeoxychorismate synthase n=1 Tax=Pelagicoccus enzymogenes TaxID=2773457 RepID=A0A927FD00_9BACT|nr:aminodeoxychorismate synthase component I [Pelagicoccus enzymogenes]MBD5781430.1 aminodeoxychorismate synthase component I [Pelagicoccus enzymogenes]